MSTTSDCCSTKTTHCSCGTILTGTLIAAGIAALAWLLLSHRSEAKVLDPLSETDRRIDALEESLRHLQDSFGHAIGK